MSSFECLIKTLRSHHPHLQLVDIPNELPKGTISPSALSTSTSLSHPLPPLPSGILLIELYPLCAQVEREVTAQHAALPGAVHVFIVRDVHVAGEGGREAVVLRPHEVWQRLLNAESHFTDEQ